MRSRMSSSLIILGLLVLTAGTALAEYPADCLGPQVPSAASCSVINDIGCCDAQGRVLYCMEDKLYCIDCATGNPECGWSSGGYYDCGTDGSADTTNPKACATCASACGANQYCDFGTCKACSCNGAVCGNDQCGNSCGTCGATESCKDGACVAVPQCTEVGTIACGDTKSGTTVGATNNITTYNCQAWTEDGPEVGYKAVIAAPDKVKISLTYSAENDLDLFVIAADTCASDKCVAGTDTGISSWTEIEAGTYFLVVDGYMGAAGEYELKVECASSCVPQCTDKQCGDNGCGGDCGTCAEGSICNELQQCEVCVPKCDNRNCGDDGCGGECGPCDGALCYDGWCYDAPGCEIIPDTTGCNDCPCQDCLCGGEDPVDPWCCENAWDSICAEECLMDCNGCGALDACGDGECVGAEDCLNCAGDCGCVAPAVCGADTGECCTPVCDGKECGDDGCGGECGGCDANEVCTEAGLCQACSCGAKVCGTDECGNSCGTCNTGEICNNAGACVPFTGGPEECLGESTPSGDDCLGVTYEGCCDGGRVLWCDGGKLYCLDCAAQEAVCGWLAQGSFYGCDTTGAADPSGANPKDCSWNACDPACDAGFYCSGGECLACACADGQECGTDQCGASCGTCNDGLVCKEGKCVEDTGGELPTVCNGPQTPSGENCFGLTYEGCCNNGIVYWCQDNALFCTDCPTNGAQCGWVTDGSYYDCTEDGLADPSGAFPQQCETGTCTPNCANRNCGSDGCGGSCGTCPEGKTCNEAGECEDDVCIPACTGKDCGDDGCGGQCGTCGAGKKCEAGLCVDDVCTPACTGKECGDDGCGGVCGTCNAGEDCVAGQCEPKTAEDISAPDVTGGQDVTENDASVGTDTGTEPGKKGGGGCSSTGSSSSAGLLLALAAALIALRRRAVKVL